MFQIPDAFRVTVAIMNLSGRADHWYHQAHKDVCGTQSMEQFEQSVLSEFEVNTQRYKLMELSTL